MNRRRHTHLKNEKGFTLVELMVALVIISILASVAISKFNDIKIRTYDTNAQTSLKSFFQACKEYWTFNSSSNSCQLSTVSTAEFGYTPPTDVEITIGSDGNNTEYDFVATARHTSSTNGFVIDHKGIVSGVTLKFEEGDGDGGKGCSQQAKEDPKNLGKKAKGGCK